MNVTIIGAVYVGLVSGSCFAEFGASVTCVDLAERRIAALKEGRITIYELGLDLARLRDLRRGNVFVDLRNVYEREVMCEAGFD